MGRYLNTLAQAADLNGISISGATLTFFEAGPTSTKLDTFFDESLVTANKNTNPVVADGEGRFTDIWLQNRSYFVELRDAGGVLIDSHDDVVSLSAVDISIGYKPIIPVFSGGVPLSNELLLQYVVPQQFVFPEDLPNSQAFANIAPTAETIFTITHEGSDVGTVTFAIATQIGTFTWANDITTVAGDIITIVAPAVADATISGISISLVTEQVTGAVNSTYSADFYVDTGTANAHILAPVGSSVAPDALEEGFYVSYRANVANTGAVTINVASLGVVPLTDSNDAAFTGGEITADQYIEARYTANSDHFYVVNGSVTTARVYNVGDLYITSVATNPATTLSYGTWSAVAEGRFLVGVGTGTDDNAVMKAFAAGNTAGEYDHPLTLAENAAHTHTGDMRVDGNSPGNGAPEEGDNATSGSFTTDSSGSGTAHNTTPPGYGAFIWLRTA